MKKAILFMIFFVFIFVLIQALTIYIKKSHDIVYSVSDGVNGFNVREKYNTGEKGAYYYLEIRSGSDIYLFDINDHFNKQRGIVKAVEFVNRQGIKCLNPLFIDKNYAAPITCIKDKKLVAYQNVAKEIPLTLFKKNINKKNYEDNNMRKHARKAYFYLKNINKDENFYFFKYRTVNIFNKKRLETIGFDEEWYVNKLGRLAGEYFYNAAYENGRIVSYKGFSILDRDTQFIKLPEALSSESYALGFYNDNLYILDPDRNTEVMIDFKKHTSEVVSTDDTGKYFDGTKLIDKPLDEMIKDKKEFMPEKHVILNSFKPLASYKDDRAYYYKDKDNNFYKVYRNNVSHPIYLFTEDVDNVIVDRGIMYYRIKDVIYKNDFFNQKKLVEYYDLPNNNYYVYGVYNKIEIEGGLW